MSTDPQVAVEAGSPQAATVEVVEAVAGPLLEWRRKRADGLRKTKTYEHRQIAMETAECEIRESDEGLLHFSGFASVTERAYDVAGYQETVKRGAFKRTLSENPDVVFLVNHAGLPLARTARPGYDGTLDLSEVDRGLKVEARFDPIDPDAARLAYKLRSGLLNEMSMAFRVSDDVWSPDYTERTIRSLSLHGGDVSTVVFGANNASTGTLRTAQDALEALHSVGPDAVIRAMAEWRDYSLIPVEQRAGKALSSTTMDVLAQVLNLVAAADEAVDEAQPLLAELMGVPNPDADDATDETDATAERSADVTETAVEPEPMPDNLTRAKQALFALRSVR
jgi:HK97 family phage prohead protease